MTLTITHQPDCDHILHWLDAHSVTLSLGVPMQVLHRRWADAGREPEELGDALEYLFAEDWVALTRNFDPPHLRLTVQGFSRLIQARDAAAAPAEETETDFEETPSAAPDPVPETARSTVPPYKPHLSEMTMRRDILGVYQDLRLKADSRLIGMTLSRYWQEMGNRAGDLRSGLDILIRDGFLISRLVGIDRYWELTPEGADYNRTAPTPDVLLRLCPPLGKIRTGEPADVVHRSVAKAVAAHPPRVEYSKLKAKWLASDREDENALLLGLELMLKFGHATIEADADPRFTLTDTGVAFIRNEPARLSSLMAKLNRVLN